LKSLNVFAFHLQPAWEVLSVQNSGANITIEPFCTETACQGWQIATGIFTFIRILIVIYQLIRTRNSYFDQHYIINDFQFLEVFHFGTTLAFLITGNWYCGLWSILQAWFTIPGMIIRLDGGTKIILIHRVFNTALSIFHILLFFIAGTGTIMLLVHGSEFSFTWTRIVPKTMAVITGEFNIDDLFPTGADVFGVHEPFYILFLVFVIFCCHIVLMNVFTGLAVGDVATVMGEAEQIKARYQMKLVANLRVHYSIVKFCRGAKSSILELEIINSDEYGSWTRMKNIAKKHYITSTTLFLMRKSKIANWLNDRPKFSSRSRLL